MNSMWRACTSMWRACIFHVEGLCLPCGGLVSSTWRVLVHANNPVRLHNAC